MIFIGFKLIVFKNISGFVNFAVFVLFCLIETDPYYGLIPYLSSKVKVILFTFSFAGLSLDFVNRFFLKKMDIKYSM